MCENEVHKWIYKRTTLPTIEREYDFYDIATISRSAPAKIYGFTDRGALTPGYRADIAVYDITKPYKIDSAEFLSMGKATPFEGEEVYGRCMLTLFGGEKVWEENK